MDRPVDSAPGSRLPARLPPLREDLQLHAGAPHADGSPSWTIQDPLNNAFYRIGWLEFELLLRWPLAEPAEILAATAAETLLQPSIEELTALHDFLLASQLLVVQAPSYTRELFARFRKSTGNRAKWLLHHYLYFRIPLLHPAERLQAALPWLQWLFRPATALVVAGLSLLGLVLTARQWDVFVASFLDTLSPGGLAAYLLALAVTKSLHELGHALTATRYGLRVAHMGVAFVVMWPMLYTDTGESWRLSDHRQRLRIASAGIVTELALAGLATLAWHLTADGDVRQALFFLATTAWVMTLALNLSPFMRFDGYFILSDALDMPNLHERASAQARVVLRNVLLGWREVADEAFAPWPRRALVAFAFTTWLYRLALFLGIAVAVYVYFFKLLGMFLFAVEIAWFVVLPAWRELKVWHARRDEIAGGRQRLALIAGGGLLLLFMLPWSYQIHAPAYAHPSQSHTFYSPLPARLIGAMVSGGTVAAGSEVFVLEQPELAYRMQLAQASQQALDEQLRGLAGLPDGEERRSGLARLFALRQAEAEAGRDEARRLVLTAPFAGLLTDLDHEAAIGSWVGQRQPLAVLVSPDDWQADLLVSQAQLSRIRPGDTVRFYPEGARLFPLAGRVIEIDAGRSGQLPHPLLSAQHGGTVPVLPDQRGMTPRDALYRVRVQLDSAPGQLRQLRGEGVIDGQPASLLLEALKPLVIVILRELSF